AVIIETVSFDAVERYLWLHVNARRNDAQTTSAGDVQVNQKMIPKSLRSSLPQRLKLPLKEVSWCEFLCFASAAKEHHGSCSVDDSHSSYFL
ncbi:hypothetical protein MKW92_020861, partial [Papaver armeniacum]